MELEKYQENGLAYPFKLNSQFSQEKLLSEYFDFQKKSEEVYLYFLINWQQMIQLFQK